MITFKSDIRNTWMKVISPYDIVHTVPHRIAHQGQEDHSKTLHIHRIFAMPGIMGLTT